MGWFTGKKTLTSEMPVLEFNLFGCNTGVSDDTQSLFFMVGKFPPFSSIDNDHRYGGSVKGRRKKPSALIP